MFQRSRRSVPASAAAAAAASAPRMTLSEEAEGALTSNVCWHRSWLFSLIFLLHPISLIVGRHNLMDPCFEVRIHVCHDVSSKSMTHTNVPVFSQCRLRGSLQGRLSLLCILLTHLAITQGGYCTSKCAGIPSSRNDIQCISSLSVQKTKARSSSPQREIFLNRQTLWGQQCTLHGEEYAIAFLSRAAHRTSTLLEPLVCTAIPPYSISGETNRECIGFTIALAGS